MEEMRISGSAVDVLYNYVAYTSRCVRVILAQGAC